MLKETDFTSKDLKKEEFKEQYKPLIQHLLTLQQEARSRDIGLVVLFEGFAASGKGTRISDLIYHLDARATKVYSLYEPGKGEVDHFLAKGCGATGPYPFLTEFQYELNDRGCATFYNRGWYTRCFQHAARSIYMGVSPDETDENITIEDARKALDAPLASIKDYEKQLVDDGYIVVKFFCNIRRKTQSKRINALYTNPSTRWRVSETTLAEAGRYDTVRTYFDYVIDKTDSDYAPWIILNGEHTRESNLAIVQTISSKLQEAISAKDAKAIEEKGKPQKAAKAPAKSAFPIEKKYPTLDGINYSLALEREEYKNELKKLQKKLSYLQRRAFLRHIPIVVMYEGWDAAGKGGNIKRVAQALDARSYTIIPSPAPTKTELAHPFLWRYWTRLPKAGHVGIFDRSWYGRVLVERVEGFAKPNEWQRAYDEINRFEQDLVDWGAVVVKFWVEIDQDEQLNRFNLRAENPEKSWKLTDEDWRNREKYPIYREAVEDMFRLTSTKAAPWTILESNDKLYARIKALNTIIAAVEKRLDEVSKQN